MALGLAMNAVRDRSAAPPLQRTFERCPVLVGRDDSIASFVLPDERVSRVHASVDIRDRRICVRDSGSTNGTFLGTERLPSDRWVEVGTLERPCEIRIGEWTLTVSACELKASAEPADGSFFLTAFEPEPEPARVKKPARQSSRPTAEWAATKTSGDGPVAAAAPPTLANEGGRHTVVTPVLQVLRRYAILVSMRNELISAIGEALDAAPAHERSQVVDEIVRACPEIAVDPVVRSLLERHAGRPIVQTVDAASAASLHELSRWYVGGPLRSTNDVFAFARKLKAGIDELLTGLVPLFAALDRFEQQMALRPEAGQAPTSTRLPRVPRDAARRLFDWTDTSDTALRAVRTDLVDLTMHQVAVLNGVMRGVKVLLAELSPGTLDKAYDKKLARRGFFGRIVGRLRASSAKWELYRERHADLADEENERFRVIFGPEFAAEYKQSGEGAPQALEAGRGAPVTHSLPANASNPYYPGGSAAASYGPPPAMQNPNAPGFPPRMLSNPQVPTGAGPRLGPGPGGRAAPATNPPAGSYPPYPSKPPNHRN